MLIDLLPPKYQAFLAALPALIVLTMKVSSAIGALGSIIEFIGMRRSWPTWIMVGKKLEAFGVDYPKLLNDHVRPLLVRIGVKGVSLCLCLVSVAFLSTACTPAMRYALAQSLAGCDKQQPQSKTARRPARTLRRSTSNCPCASRTTTEAAGVAGASAAAAASVAGAAGAGGAP